MKDKDTHIAAVGKGNKRKSGSKEVDASQDETMSTLKEETEGSSSSSKNSPPNDKEERHEKQHSLSCKKTRGR